MPSPTQLGQEYQSFYSWKRRRRFMFVVAAFCAVTVAYVLLADKQGSVAETSVTMSFLTLMGITGSYVFGAVWQDVRHMTSGVGKGGVS